MKYTIHYVATSTSVKKVTLTVVCATDKRINFFPTKIIKNITNGGPYGLNV